jgi:hypothetical protein
MKKKTAGLARQSDGAGMPYRSLQVKEYRAAVSEVGETAGFAEQMSQISSRTKLPRFSQ